MRVKKDFRSISNMNVTMPENTLLIKSLYWYKLAEPLSTCLTPHPFHKVGNLGSTECSYFLLFILISIYFYSLIYLVGDQPMQNFGLAKSGSENLQSLQGHWFLLSFHFITLHVWLPCSISAHGYQMVPTTSAIISFF